MTGERPLTTCTAACPACPCQTWGQAHTIRPSGPPGVSRGLAGAGAATSRPAGPRGPAGAGAGAPSQRPVPSRRLCLRPLGQRLPLCFGHRGCVVTSSIVQVALAHLRTRVSLPRLHSDASSGSALLLAVSTCEVPATLSREYRFCPSNAWRVPRSVAALRVLSLSPGLPGTPRTAPDTFARCTDTVRALLQSARERGDGTMFVGVEAQCPSQPGIIQGVLTIRTSGSLSTHDRKSLRPRPGHGGPGRTCRARQQQHRPGELCADTRT